MSRPVHFELPVDDQARAATFYRSVFGWDIHQWEGAPYWLANTGPDDQPGIHGALGVRGPDFPVPMFVIGVDDLDASIAAVEEAGATVVLGKNCIPGVGWSAYFVDTEGNRLGLFQSDESAQVE